MRRILLDHNVPAPLCHLLIGHAAVPACQLAWAELANGELIAAAEQAGFEVLLTADTNIRYQQNQAKRRIALVVLETNRMATLRTGVDRIIAAIEAASPGSFVSIPFDRPLLRRRPFKPAGHAGEFGQKDE
jgi:hypothetical protein